MKKSLSVILSTTMALSAFSTAALAATSADFSDLSKLSAADKAIFDQLIKDGIFLGKGDGKFGVDDNMKRSEFAVAISKALKLTADAKTSSFADVKEDAPELPYIEAAYKAKVANGNGTTPNTFSPADEVSKEHLAVFLVGALGADAKKEAEGAKGTDKTVSDWAQGYVATAVKYKLLVAKADGTFGGTDKATRYELAKGVAATQAAIAAKSQATKVEAVTAENLKEVEVKFNGKVDQASAENKDNYSLSSGKVYSAELNADGTSVRLTVEGRLSNQTANKLSVSNIKAGNNIVETKNVAFTPIDNTLPTVVEVKNLGTKALKVVFSEPVEKAPVGSFKIDGKTFYGAPSGEGTREIILTPYDGSLTVGEHTITVSGVVDFFGLKSLSTEHKFEVVEDKTAPTVTNVDATLERAVVTFSEEVDSTTVAASNVYWKNGDSKKKAGLVRKIAANKYEFDFTANPLPGFETILFVEGVKDYSGNAITETQVKVNAEVDKVRPEVVDVKASTAAPKKITVKFSKPVDAADKKFFTVKNSDGDVLSIRSVTRAAGDYSYKVFEVELFEDLTAGTNTIKVSGVQDKTALKNMMLDYETSIKLADEAAPTIGTGSVSANSAERTIYINYGKKMDLATINDSRNYLIKYNGGFKNLPEGTEVTPVQDGKAVRIILPQYIGDMKVTFTANGVAGSVSEIQVVGVRDAAGNPLQGQGVGIALAQVNAGLAAYDTSKYGNSHAVLTEKNLIKVKFNQPIGVVRASDFTVAGRDIVGTEVDGNVVTLKLNDSNSTYVAANALVVKANNAITTTTGNQIGSGVAITADIFDAVKPEVRVTTPDGKLANSGNVIYLTFSENLRSGIGSFYKEDLVVTRLNGGGVVPTTQLDTAVVTGNTIAITVNDAVSGAKEYSVKVKANAGYIADLAGNKAAESSTYETNLEYVSVPVAPTSPTLAQGTTAGQVKINGVTTAMEYRLNYDANGWTTITTTSVDVPANIGDTLEVRYAPVGTTPGSTPKVFTVKATDIKAVAAPTASFAKGATVGATTITGLTAGTDVYRVNGGAWIEVPAALVLNVAPGTVIEYKVKAETNGKPANAIGTHTVSLTDIKLAAAPSVTLAQGTAVGTTNITGLTANVVYEYRQVPTVQVPNVDYTWTTLTGVTAQEVNATSGLNFEIRIKDAGNGLASDSYVVLLDATNVKL
ncbi:S-layer homology domain-containing protein [Paenibacillus sp. N1-5-1-14]|uniref:S-layer homology domain-containing protein n=1 Tax=Paenibacillus radicibacter TaxID=2972488 RepID=UPI0021591FE4|nr:S-layer homology domain-containing protein [Paenibacillus radicibacter]MCR8645059.1 S-layer homology domain-containing protein [Paenibacillus radicibacter]